MAQSGTRLVESDLPPTRKLASATPPLSHRRANALLAAGSLAGVALALAGLVRIGGQGSSLPPGVIARVNDDLIPLQEYERTIAALARDRRAPLTEEDRKFALERLIDETLLLQRALELDLARNDPQARRALIRAVLDSVAASADDVQVGEDELRRFYEMERAWFRRPGRLRVRQVWVRAESNEERTQAEQRAQEAYQRLRAGEDFATVQRELGDREPYPLPDALLPPAKLADFLGSTALRTVLELSPGEVSAPVRSGNGFHILQVVEREAEETPPLDEIRPQVLAEFRRRAAEQALRTYLDELRARANIVLPKELPRSP